MNKLARHCKYGYECPVGTWPARLDDKAWGKKTAGVLRLFFTRLNTGEKFALYTFYRNNYRPVKWGPDFHQQVKIGDTLLLTTGRTRRGTSKFIAAGPLSNSDKEYHLKLESAFMRATA